MAANLANLALLLKQRVIGRLQIPAMILVDENLNIVIQRFDSHLTLRPPTAPLRLRFYYSVLLKWLVFGVVIAAELVTDG